jgi:hypothetical protein
MATHAAGENDIERSENQAPFDRWLRQDLTKVRLLILYYVVLLFVVFGFLLDFWCKASVLTWLRIDAELIETDPWIRIVGIIISSGALGSILYHGRQITHYYGNGTFNARWQPRNVIAPFLGAGLSLIVLALIQGGIAALGYQIEAESIADSKSKFFAIGFGAVVGFSSRIVVTWLQSVCKTMFGLKYEEPDRESHG